MSLIECEHCGKPFFAHHKRCIHCRALREDVPATPVLKKPLSLLISMLAVASLLLVWGLTEPSPLHAAEDNRSLTITDSEQQP